MGLTKKGHVIALGGGGGGGVTLIPILNSEKGTISKNTKAFYKVAYAMTELL